MNLKNYTSGVPVETTIMRIEQYLIGTGLVSGIGKEYSNGIVTSIGFQISYEADKLPLTVRIAAKVEDCQEFFWKDYCQSRRQGRKTKDDFQEQAARTAWKLQEDWIRVETSLILLHQRTVLESFISFVWDGERTFVQRIVDSKYKMLAAPKSE